MAIQPGDWVQHRTNAYSLIGTVFVENNLMKVQWRFEINSKGVPYHFNYTGMFDPSYIPAEYSPEQIISFIFNATENTVPF